MRILIYSLNYAPEPTGTGKYSGEMAVWFAAHGHEVSVICGLPHYPQWKLDVAYADGRARVEACSGVQVYRAPHFVPSRNGLGSRARIWLETSFTLSAARYWLRRLVSRQKPDVMIAVMPPMQVGVWPLLYGWLRRVPWVLHVQDLQVDAALRLGMLKGRSAGRMLYAVEAFLLRHATRVSTITEAMRRRVVEKGVAEQNVWLFPNWSDVCAICPSPRDNAFRRSLNLADDAIVVLYAGNMGHKQGLDVVLKAAAECTEASYLYFVMIGDGAAREALEQRAVALALQNLRFLPIQPLDRLNEMLAAGDIHLVVQKRSAADLVMPSKLTNILAAGRACIATADEGTALADVVSGFDAGLVTLPEDGSELARAIRTLAGDEALRERMGANGRRYAERYLNRDTILGRFEAQLQSLGNTMVGR